MARTAIVTGATRGIGRATALHLLEEGYDVVLNYHANEANAAAVLKESSAPPGRAVTVKADVSKANDIHMLIETTFERFGRIDLLVNNAGINIDRPVFELTEEEWDRVVNTNMKGVFLASQAAGRIMFQQDGGGHIINLGATTGITGRANGLNYCAAKAGVIVMTKCLAIEFAPKVRVNCVIPGTILTPEVEERYDLAAHESTMAERILLKRIGEPREIAKAIRFLDSDDGGYITGQKLIVDGGDFLY